jgi:molecular chaperone DnaK (HSP70)
VTIITNQSGNRVTPSWVAFTDTDRLVGEAAKNQAVRKAAFLHVDASVFILHSLFKQIRNPKNTVFDSKRMIGHRYSYYAVARMANEKKNDTQSMFSRRLFQVR